ncbi:Nn.00g088000.m01.CDS01 [Neocucurbitaria sp. VM-36]
MGYNTRRKSLSLPSLGIHLPGAPRSARSPPSTSDTQHIAKKQKRSHSGSSASSPASPPRPSTLRFDEQRPKSSAGRVADTPPPSPGGESGSTKVDTQGIDDEIVVGVIEQLEKTGNRPHLLKELATVLSPTIPIVESSANPAAIISSRLATYLKRNWTALSRCPLDKKLVGTHPKRVYYFLSTCPHQPIPTDAGTVPAAARIISPSLSSAASEEEDMDARSRDRMSPSPELDLSDYDSNSSDPFSSQSHPPTTANIAHNRRAQSPPLEKDEREFTQTASFLQQRRRSQEAERERSTSASVETAPASDVIMDEVSLSVEETEESAARKNSEAAAALFGQMEHTASFQTALAPSSPALKPTLHIDMPPPSFKPSEVKLEVDDDDWHMKSPETIELDELDDLFDEY